MKKEPKTSAQTLPGGVMFNAYPDSIGKKLADTVEFLKRPELKDTFSLFYILPTFFNSDLDRGFSIIDYDINEELVKPENLDDLNELGIQIKLDLVLNHLSVRSPQFQDLLINGKDSPYRDFFIDWDEFWSVVKGDGPCNKERIAHKVGVGEDAATLDHRAGAGLVGREARPPRSEGVGHHRRHVDLDDGRADLVDHRLERLADRFQ